MSIIKVHLPEGTIPCQGKQVTFRAPCDCKDVSGIIINDKVYELVDSMSNPTSTGSSFCAGAMISVLLDVENSKAYLLNQSNYQIPWNIEESVESICYKPSSMIISNSQPGPHTKGFYLKNSGKVRFSSLLTISSGAAVTCKITKITCRGDTESIYDKSGLTSNTTGSSTKMTIEFELDVKRGEYIEIYLQNTGWNISAALNEIELQANSETPYRYYKLFD